MRYVVTRLTLGLVVATGLMAIWQKTSAADTTSTLLLSLDCGDYQVQVAEDLSSGAYLYRSEGPSGDFALNIGHRDMTEGVVLYEFQNGSFEYWVWDGTLDDPEAGQLQVYRSGQIVLDRSCTQ